MTLRGTPEFMWALGVLLFPFQRLAPEQTRLPIPASVSRGDLLVASGSRTHTLVKKHGENHFLCSCRLASLGGRAAVSLQCKAAWSGEWTRETKGAQAVGVAELWN